jgi:hypothetical protein
MGVEVNFIRIKVTIITCDIVYTSERFHYVFPNTVNYSAKGTETDTTDKQT